MPTTNFKRSTWPSWEFSWFSSILPYKRILRSATTAFNVYYRSITHFYTVSDAVLLNKLQIGLPMCMSGLPPSDKPSSSPTKSLSWWSYLIQCHITFAIEKPSRKSESLPYSSSLVCLTFQRHKQDLYQIADACCTIHWIPTASKFFNAEEFSCHEIAQWRRTQVQGLSIVVSRLTVPYWRNISSM